MCKSYRLILSVFLLIILGTRCTKNEQSPSLKTYPAVQAAFGDHIDLNNLANYAAQQQPAYITKDNAAGQLMSDAKATLGRVLFYDKNLSIDNSVSCSSCHRQEFAFSDTALVSKGVEGGVTTRHSMRLVNARFSDEKKFFWNERAATLEAQTTQPMQDHAEMGFSGQNGRPGFNDLLNKLGGISYYNELFQFVYGDIHITETRLQECLSQFVRSIQSFDAKYDAGRALVPNDNIDFPNFTVNENLGKRLFLAPPVFDIAGNRINGGAGCNGCHRAPEFDIDPNSGNNGITGIINNTGRDLTNTKAPSLRDMTRTNGIVNSPMMHTGANKTLRNAIAHYDTINFNPAQNPTLDPKLRPNGVGQKLNLSEDEIRALVAFLQTLSGTRVYTEEK